MKPIEEKHVHLIIKITQHIIVLLAITAHSCFFLAAIELWLEKSYNIVVLPVHSILLIGTSIMIALSIFAVVFTIILDIEEFYKKHKGDK